MRDGKCEEAAKIYERLIELDDNDLKAWLGASFAYLKLADYARCFDDAARVLTVDRSNARAFALAGVALLRLGYLKQASTALQNAITLDSKEALAYGGAAEVDYYEGRVNEARRWSLYAHNLDQNEPDYLITYARASSRAEDFKEAADAYERFLQVAPERDAERRDRIRGLISFYRQLAGLRIHQVAGAERADAPFYLGSDRRPYLRVRLNGRKALFVVDTGSGFTVISKEAAKRFGVEEIARGGHSQGVGGTGKFPIVYGLIRSIDIGAVTLRMAPCFIRSFHDGAEQALNERADGFIGLSILSRYLTELDYEAGMLRLDRREGKSLPEAGPGVTVVPFRTTQNGLISIEAEIDGANTVNAILDSGASSMVISTAAVDRFKLHGQIIKGETRSVTGAAGVTPNVSLLLIANCKVAGTERSNLQALIMDLKAINETSGFEQSAILGGDFLRHCRLTIDFNRGQVAFSTTPQGRPANLTSSTFLSGAPTLNRYLRPAPFF
jgi:predicted aspartyl protease